MAPKHRCTHWRTGSSASKRLAERAAHEGTIVTGKVDEMWGTDMSQTVTLEEGRAYVFVAVEHANSEIVGIHARRDGARASRSLPSPGAPGEGSSEPRQRAGAPIVCDSLRHESRTLRFPGGYDRPGQHPDKGLSDRGDG